MKELFKEWLKENIMRFKYKPYMIEEGIYGFRGINGRVELCINDNSFEILICFLLNEEVFDLIIIEYVGELRIDENGFFDADRKVTRRYKTFKDLLFDDFEKIIEFVNRNFKEENKICFIEFKGARFVFITNKKDECSNYKEFIVEEVDLTEGGGKNSII